LIVENRLFYEKASNNKNCCLLYFQFLVEATTKNSKNEKILVDKRNYKKERNSSLFSGACVLSA